VIHLGRNTWRELEKRVIRSLKVVYSKTENKGDYSFIHSFRLAEYIAVVIILICLFGLLNLIAFLFFPQILRAE